MIDLHVFAAIELAKILHQVPLDDARPDSPPGDIIDVEAREVPDAPALPAPTDPPA